MMTIAQEYIDKYGDAAIRHFVDDLEAGDPTIHKAGYSHENAIIAASEAFNISRTAVTRSLFLNTLFPKEQS